MSWPAGSIWICSVSIRGATPRSGTRLIQHGSGGHHRVAVHLKVSEAGAVCRAHFMGNCLLPQLVRCWAVNDLPAQSLHAQYSWRLKAAPRFKAYYPSPAAKGFVGRRNVCLLARFMMDQPCIGHKTESRDRQPGPRGTAESVSRETEQTGWPARPWVAVSRETSQRAPGSVGGS